MLGAAARPPATNASPGASPEPESESESGVPSIGTEDPCQNAVQIPEDNFSQATVKPKRSHYVRNCPWKVFARSLEKDEKQCPGSNQAPSQPTDKKDGTLQPNSGANRTVIWKMDNGWTMIITSSEFTPEDAARIPKRQRRKNTFRGARQLTRHLIKYGPPRPEDDESGERFSADDDDDDDDDDNDATLDSFRERELKFKACTRCGVVGHTDSL
uniref:Uncharacterized protein n=1 Tax=Oryza sativa subsp. japonica TaxID=39947 RepID=Q6K2J3_ORYSJ|nr:hypothetical protein [Oryza sativa Japonica Group]BAD22479.1 hypothetical protein [Oryza sativa Japonica Group]